MIKYTSRRCVTYGGIAQLARAIGSYPIGHGFKSSFRYHLGPLVKRLRHGPFTAVTWVRFPYGSPKRKSTTIVVLFLFGGAYAPNRTHHRACAGSGSQIRLSDGLCSHKTSQTNLVPRALARRHLPVHYPSTNLYAPNLTYLFAKQKIMGNNASALLVLFLACEK